MLFLFLACIGNKDSGDPNESTNPDLCEEQPSLSIGDGEELFSAIAPDSSLVMTHGAQGGWHMLSSVMVENMDMIVTLHYTIDVLPEMTRISDNNYRVQLKADGDCKGTYWNMYGYLDVTPIVDGELDSPPELLCDRQLRMTIEASDSQGNAASDSVDVIATNDPADTCGAE